MGEPIVMENEGSERVEHCIRWSWHSGSVSYAMAGSSVDYLKALLDEEPPFGIAHGELMRRTITTTPWEPVLPPGVDEDAAFVIGIDHDAGPLHAVSRRAAGLAVTRNALTAAACGQSVRIARDWGTFERGNNRIDDRDACIRCGWAAAVATGQTDRELLALHPPSAAHHDTLVRELANPFLYLDVCRKLLRDMEDEGPPERFVQLLAAASEHRPQVFIPTWCAEGDCGHDEQPRDCYAESNLVMCAACTVTAGSWAGEYEGQVEVQVPASECPVLPGIAKMLDLQAVAS